MARAGLTGASVIAAGAELADEVGLDRLSMGLLAERLGVKSPSLYKHVNGLADLVHGIAVQAGHELSGALRDATQGRAGSDALHAAAQAFRTFVLEHPGQYAAGNNAPVNGPDDPLIAARGKVLESMKAVLRGYELGPAQEIHALRMLRSVMHGFASLEADGGFQFATDVDESYAWLIEFADRSRRATTAESATSVQKL